MDKNRKIGILGSGGIAEKMASTLASLDGYDCSAIASRSKEKAESFASRFGIPNAYGSYEELAEDPEVELIYIATPHSHHFQHAKLCIEHGKAVLCEKAFTANAREAEELFRLAAEKGVFITEAIWTRYMPLSLQIINLVRNGAIGHPYTLSANLCYPLSKKARIQRPELAGGALLDIGVYALNFAAMIYGDEIERTVSACTKTETGMDDQNSITQFFSDNRMAVLYSSIYPRSDRKGIISGDRGYIIVENINNPEIARLYNLDYQLIAEYPSPKQITGYEYQVIASFEAMDKGLLESPYMPHKETIRIMRMMDELRREWGVVYPNDIQTKRV